MQENIKIQPFAVTKDGNFLLVTDLTEEVFNNIFSNIEEDFVNKIDNNAWIMELVEGNTHIPENISKIFVVLSRDELAVSNFMNGAFFAEDVLKKFSSKELTSENLIL